jgi:hypothetical protein
MFWFIFYTIPLSYNRFPYKIYITDRKGHKRAAAVRFQMSLTQRKSLEKIIKNIFLVGEMTFGKNNLAPFLMLFPKIFRRVKLI